MRDKAAYYLANGAQMVWLVFPSQRVVEVYTPDDEVQILVMGDVLAAGDLLPGFLLLVEDIFSDPLA